MTQAFTEVRAAAGFLTRLPVGAVGDRVGAGAFGLVGGGIGLVAAVPLAVLGGSVPLIAAVLAIAVVVIVTVTTPGLIARLTRLPPTSARTGT